MAGQLRAAAETAERPSQVVSLGALVGDLRADCERSLTDEVTLTVNTVTPETLVRVSRGAIGEALMNICANAREAMPEGGALTITADTVSRDHEGGQRRFAVIAIADTGKGIPVALLPKVFEPFASTKNTVGVGVSLAVTHRTIEDHGGVVEAASAPGQGATFSVFLPAVEDTKPVGKEAPEAGDHGGQRHG